MNTVLEKSYPFSTLPAAGVKDLVPHVSEESVPAGHMFFAEGEGTDIVFLLRKGRANIQHSRPDGSVRTVCVVGPGDTFCCLPALDGGTYPASAIAAEPSVVYRMPGPLFRGLVEQHPAFARAVLKQFCGRLREAGCEGCARADDAGSRIAGRLVGLMAKFGETIPLTRRELGEMAGTTVETAIRITREFEELGWLELGRNRIRVLDLAALKRRTQGEHSIS
ncbi:MAG: Crp/Fnr family transcriptional regulator [Candidatus Eiseniibacteriota bacterium]